MSVIQEVEDLYREPFELKASLAWGVSGLVTCVGGVMTTMPPAVTACLVLTSVAMAVKRAWEAKELIDAKVNLAGREFWLMPTKELEQVTKKHPEHLWLGRGFRWTGAHTARALQLNKMNPEMMLPPRWMLKLMGRPSVFEEMKGEQWIHGVEPVENNLFMPWVHSEGNWNIFGTTGAGKTRLYETLCYQIVKRGDVLIVIDPKYDKDLEATLKKVCKSAGRPDAFARFHPAFPSDSVRLDPLANFNRKTEIASRLADIVGGGGAPGDNFVAFIWRVLDGITGGLLYVGEKPSLKKLRYYIEAGPEELVERCLKKYLSGWNPSAWEDHVGAIRVQIENRKLQPKLKTGTSRQQAMVQVYHEQVDNQAKSDDLNALISIAEHSREHYGKMIAGLLPLLAQLTAGPLGEMLSPDYSDLKDDREILDMERVIRGHRVLYIATDSLADSTVGSAIAAILLSDLRAVAGTRYNYGSDDDDTRIHILCDEAAETVTPPLISIMNKGRGAGMITYLATQNFSDYVHKFGSEDAARMVVGNANNRLCLRVVDTKTQQFMVESFGEVNVASATTTTSRGAESETVGMEYRTGSSTQVKEAAAELFPGYLLGKLPDLHFVAAVSGGKVYKGRLPKLVN